MESTLVLSLQWSSCRTGTTVAQLTPRYYDSYAMAAIQQIFLTYFLALAILSRNADKWRRQTVQTTNNSVPVNRQVLIFFFWWCKFCSIREGAYKQGKNYSCAGTWRSNGGGALLSGEYSTKFVFIHHISWRITWNDWTLRSRYCDTVYLAIERYTLTAGDHCKHQSWHTSYRHKHQLLG